MPNRLRILLATLAVVLFGAVYQWDPWDGEPVPTGVAPADSASATAHAALVDPAADSAERAGVEALAREWLGPQRWHVGPYSDSTFEFIPVTLADTSDADLARAFVTLGALRDSAAAIELVGGIGGPATLVATNLDSIVRVGAKDNWGGCSIPLMLPMRRSVDTASFVGGFVPGMVTLVAPVDTNAVAHREEALRLLAALPDSVVVPDPLDSLRGAAWTAPSLELWHADSLELLVASRRRATLFEGKYEHYVEEQLVIAERPLGSAGRFVRRLAWHTAYDTDETNSMWIVTGARVGPRHRFAFLVGYEGKESTGESFMVRAADGRWYDAVMWSTGC